MHRAIPCLILLLTLLSPGPPTVPLFAQDYRPLEAARRGTDPAPDVWSQIQETALRSFHLDTSDPVQVLVLPVEFVDVRGQTPVDALAAHFFGTEDDSLASYYRQVSGGKVRIEGTVHDWIEAILPRRLLTRIPNSVGSGPYYRLLLEHLSLDELEDLDRYDLVVFVIAGERVERWSTVLWPHAGGMDHNGTSLRKIVLAERRTSGKGFSRRTLHHEFGHALGIADKYCYLNSFGIEHECEVGRIGRHCLMGWGGSPCAWCRIEMGWTEPVVLARGIDQDLALHPLETGGRVAKIYLGQRSRYLLIAHHEGQLRVWRLGEPWRRFRNHLLWADLDGVLATSLEGRQDFELPDGLAIEGAHETDGEIRLRLVDGR